MEFQKIQEIITGVLDISPELVTEKSSFYDDLGADSVDLLQILTLIEDTFDVEISDMNPDHFHTVGDAVRALAAAR